MYNSCSATGFIFILKRMTINLLVLILEFYFVPNCILPPCLIISLRDVLGGIS